MEGPGPIVLEVGVQTVALARSDLDWLVATLTAELFADPAPAELAGLLGTAAAAAETGNREPIVLTKLQRQVLRVALDHRLEELTAPTESLKLLNRLLR